MGYVATQYEVHGRVLSTRAHLPFPRMASSSLLISVDQNSQLSREMASEVEEGTSVAMRETFSGLALREKGFAIYKVPGIFDRREVQRRL